MVKGSNKSKKPSKNTNFVKSDPNKTKVYKIDEEKEAKRRAKYTVKAPEKKLLAKPIINAKIIFEEDDTYTIKYVVESKLKIDDKDTLKSEVYFIEKYYDIPKESIEEFSEVRAKLEEFADENKVLAGEVIYEGDVIEAEGIWN